MKTLNFENFVKSYLDTAAWITVDSGDCDTFTKDAKKYAAEDCKKFIEKVCAAFPENEANELLCILGNDVHYRTACDFFLTRNRHGAGFWDSPEIYGGEENAKILTEIAHSCGETGCYHIRGKKSKLTFD